MTVRLLDESVDAPHISGVILLSNDIDNAAALEILGRPMRNWPGKRYAEILHISEKPMAGGDLLAGLVAKQEWLSQQRQSSTDKIKQRTNAVAAKPEQTPGINELPALNTLNSEEEENLALWESEHYLPLFSSTPEKDIPKLRQRLDEFYRDLVLSFFGNFSEIGKSSVESFYQSQLDHLNRLIQESEEIFGPENQFAIDLARKKEEFPSAVASPGEYLRLVEFFRQNTYRTWLEQVAPSLIANIELLERFAKDSGGYQSVAKNPSLVKRARDLINVPSYLLEKWSRFFGEVRKGLLAKWPISSQTAKKRLALLRERKLIKESQPDSSFEDDLVAVLRDVSEQMTELLKGIYQPSLVNPSHFTDKRKSSLFSEKYKLISSNLDRMLQILSILIPHDVFFKILREALKNDVSSYSSLSIAQSFTRLVFISHDLFNHIYLYDFVVFKATANDYLGDAFIVGNFESYRSRISFAENNLKLFEENLREFRTNPIFFRGEVQIAEVFGPLSKDLRTMHPSDPLFYPYWIKESKTALALAGQLDSYAHNGNIENHVRFTDSLNLGQMVNDFDESVLATSKPARFDLGGAQILFEPSRIDNMEDRKSIHAGYAMYLDPPISRIFNLPLEELRKELDLNSCLSLLERIANLKIEESDLRGNLKGFLVATTNSLTKVHSWSVPTRMQYNGDRKIDTAEPFAHYWIQELLKSIASIILTSLALDQLGEPIDWDKTQKYRDYLNIAISEIFAEKSDQDLPSAFKKISKSSVEPQFNVPIEVLLPVLTEGELDLVLWNLKIYLEKLRETKNIFGSSPQWSKIYDLHIKYHYLEKGMGAYKEPEATYEKQVRSMEKEIFGIQTILHQRNPSKVAKPKPPARAKK